MTGVAIVRVLDWSASPTAGGSNGFVAVRGLGALPLGAAQTAVVKLPDHILRHSAQSGGFKLSATLAAGSPLPSWVGFDGTNGSFTVQPPAGTNAQVGVAVNARCRSGNTASTTLTLVVTASAMRWAQRHKMDVMDSARATGGDHGNTNGYGKDLKRHRAEGTL